MKKYSDDFGEALKQIADDENADPLDLYYYLNQIAKIGLAIKNKEFSSEDVDEVFAHTGITNEILQKILDKFLFFFISYDSKNNKYVKKNNHFFFLDFFLPCA